MDDKTKSSFMEAMRSIAKIATQGTRVGSCEMEYQVKQIIQIDGDGYVHENQMDSFLFSMEKESPKDFETYQKLKKESGDNHIEAELFALQWAMKNLKLIAGNRTDYEKHQKEQYDKLQEVELERTFAGADTSSKESFLTSLRERLQTNQSLQLSFFLDQISKMTKTPGEYLFRSKQVLYARA